MQKIHAPMKHENEMLLEHELLGDDTLQGVWSYMREMLFPARRSPRFVRYFAYGANVSPDRMRSRGVDFLCRVPAVLHDHRLKFNKRSGVTGVGYANLVKCGGGCVQGALYEISDDGLETLDHYEPGYRRRSLMVCIADRDLRADVYVARRDTVSDGLTPSVQYLDDLLEGRDCFSHEYLERLLRLRQIVKVTKRASAETPAKEPCFRCVQPSKTDAV
jgi:gamma-glutamylcyclotransferase